MGLSMDTRSYARGTPGPSIAARARTITILRFASGSFRSKSKAPTSWRICRSVPELPEVETIVRALAPRLTGRVVKKAAYLATRVLRGSPRPKIERRAILGVERYGKHILLRFEHGVLSIHLGMTGKLLLNGSETPYTRARFTLDEGVLLFDDIRQFGRIEWNPERLG